MLVGPGVLMGDWKLPRVDVAAPQAPELRDLSRRLERGSWGSTWPATGHIAMPPRNNRDHNHPRLLCDLFMGHSLTQKKRPVPRFMPRSRRLLILFCLVPQSWGKLSDQTLLPHWFSG